MLHKLTKELHHSHIMGVFCLKNQKSAENRKTKIEREKLVFEKMWELCKFFL